MILSIAPIQVENERNLSIAGLFSRVRQWSLTIENLAMLTFINKNSQLHEKLNDEDVKDEDINLTEEPLKSNNELESNNETI